MIFVIASIEIEADRRDDFLVEFHRIVPEVQQEDGCLEYGPTVDLETNIAAQPPVRDNVVVVVEKWESIEHLERHLIAPHMLEYRKRVQGIVKGATIQVLQPA
ncbi:MAG: quinol monooxygenase YgiN [Pirellulaceae bacterium]|jgi:quinol monooxygenase YgiN